MRAFGTDNVVRGNTISRTGLRRDTFGEGVYVGSAQSNWCQHSACGPMTGADSWLDAKGNDWLIEGNRGANVAEVDGPGYGFAATNTTGNTIDCHQQVSDADSGFSDQPCVR